jgi:outer membrane protein TolC
MLEGSPMPKFLPLAALLTGAAIAQPPALPPNPQAQTVAEAPLHITMEDALARARAVSPQLLSANLGAQIAHQDTVQAKAALLPNAQAFSQYIYTQPNGTLTGIFVSNDGPHVYNDQAQIHGDIYAPGKIADYHRAIAAEAVARARADLAVRGIVATVAQNYYGMVVGERKLANAHASLNEAQTFLDITTKLEAGGEAAHVDVVKAQILVEQRQRDLQDAELAAEKARIGLAVLIFPNYRQNFTVEDNLDSAVTLPDFPVIQSLASNNNPDIRAAQAAVLQSNYEVTSARAALYPSLSFDYFYGINANQFALHDPYGHNNLGSAAQAQLTVPIWTWGAARSKIRQAEMRVQQARADLTATQRELLGNLNSYYLEAQSAAAQLASLRRSVALSQDNLRLTQLRYQAGESTAQEVVDAQNGLTQARAAYDDGLSRYRLAIANLQTLTGTF